MKGLSLAISVALLFYLILRIVGSLFSSKHEVVVKREFRDDRPKLPQRTEDEIQGILASMPNKWVIYPGMTPPIQLRVRAISEEMYRRYSRAHMDLFGQDKLDPLPMAEKLEVIKGFLPDVNAHAYVLDWKGVTYPNGHPLPFSYDRLAAMMREDEALREFVSAESFKLSQEAGLA